MDNDEFKNLLSELNSLNGESEISEFKESNYKAELIGQNISALANSATLHEKEHAYLIFGVNDQGEIVGTKFNPKKRYKNQDIKL